MGGGDWFKVVMRNLLLKCLLLSMCCAQLGPKLALMPGAEMFSVGTHSTLLLSVPRYMYRFHSLFALLDRSLPLYFCPWLYVAVSGFWWWEGGVGSWGVL